MQAIYLIGLGPTLDQIMILLGRTDEQIGEVTRMGNHGSDVQLLAASPTTEVPNGLSSSASRDLGFHHGPYKLVSPSTMPKFPSSLCAHCSLFSYNRSARSDLFIAGRWNEISLIVKRLA